MLLVLTETLILIAKNGPKLKVGFTPILDNLQIKQLTWAAGALIRRNPADLVLFMGLMRCGKH